MKRIFRKNVRLNTIEDVASARCVCAGDHCDFQSLPSTWASFVQRG